MAEKKRVVCLGYVSLLYTLACAVADATDDEILAACNAENYCGTSMGWCFVVRDTVMAGPNGGPLPCADDPSRVHYLVGC